MSKRCNHDLQFEVEYATRVCALHETVWRRFGVLLTIVSVAGATAAFAGYLKENAELAAISSLVLAVLSVVNLVLNPGARASLQARWQALCHVRGAHLRSGPARL